MKRLGFCFVILGIMIGSATAQNKADAILGVWWNEEKDAKIEVYRTGIAYAGKIVWLKREETENNGKPLLDEKNPDQKLRTRRINGLQFMSGFRFDADDNEWSDGRIYDAKSGKTYKCFLTLSAKNTLRVRGYVGASWMGLGRTTIWQRVE